MPLSSSPDEGLGVAPGLSSVAEVLEHGEHPPVIGSVGGRWSFTRMLVTYFSTALGLTFSSWRSRRWSVPRPSSVAPAAHGVGLVIGS